MFHHLVVFQIYGLVLSMLFTVVSQNLLDENNDLSLAKTMLYPVLYRDNSIPPQQTLFFFYTAFVCFYIQPNNDSIMPP